MTENEHQESCTTRIKIWCKAFYKAPCFWLKIISLLIIIGLAVFGLYQIITSALHYFGKPLSHFDPERLGQLGDFLGGTLNPIFGFATVCLLLWSVFIQRKELLLTKEELKRSAAALENQFNLATDEYNRKSLEAEIIENNNKYIQLLDTNFNAILVTSIYEDGTRSIPFPATNLRRVLDSATRNTNQVSTNIFSTPPLIIHPMELKTEIERNIKYKVDIYTQLIAVIRNNIVVNKNRKTILDTIDLAKKAGFLSQADAETYIQQIGTP